MSLTALTGLDGTELLCKVLIGRRGSHLLKSLLPIGEMLEPLVDLLGWYGQSSCRLTSKVTKSSPSGVLSLLKPGRNSELGRPPAGMPRGVLPPRLGREPKLSRFPFPGITPPDDTCRGCEEVGEDTPPRPPNPFAAPVDDGGGPSD